MALNVFTSVNVRTAELATRLTVDVPVHRDGPGDSVNNVIHSFYAPLIPNIGRGKLCGLVQKVFAGLMLLLGGSVV